jgi:hypothetical protein
MGQTRHWVVPRHNETRVSRFMKVGTVREVVEIEAGDVVSG